MRILHVINTLQVGGAEVLLKDLAPRLRDDGISVEIAVLNLTGSYLEKELREQGITVVSLADAGVYSPRHISPLARKIREFDAVHVQLFPAQLWVALAARRFRLRTPLITTEQNTHNRRRKWWFRPLDRWMYAQYRFVVCISKATEYALAAWVPSCRPKIRIIPNAVAIERFASAKAADRRTIAAPPDIPLILCVGRFEPQKDHATLLRALALVPSAHLILVGDGVLRGQLETLAHSLGVSERVHFLGRRSDVPELIKMADVYVQSSRWEGFGIAVVEAMAAGVPVVVSRVPGVREVVGQSGLFFEAGDQEQLARQLISLLSQPQERARLAQAGQERAGDFRIERCAEQHVRLYQEALDRVK